MNQENLNRLKDQIIKAGFGEGMVNDLKEKMEQGLPTIELKHALEMDKDKVEATLNFRKSQSSDNYFFNSYNMAVTHDKSDKVVNQKFYIGQDNEYSFSEACNLMAGRYVNKDLNSRLGEQYNSWVKIDFNDADPSGNFKMKHFNEAYKYDLEQALAKHPIKELANKGDKAKLIEALKNGERPAVTFVKDGVETKGFVEANVQFRKVNVLDENQKWVRQSQSQKQGQNKGQKAKVDENATKKTGKRKSQGIS